MTQISKNEQPNFEHFGTSDEDETPEDEKSKVHFFGSMGQDNDREYWWPSYMFHWLQAIGRRTDEAYEAFGEYTGRTSYEELDL